MILVMNDSWIYCGFPHLVANDLSLSIVLEMSVALESIFYKLAKLFGEYLVVEKMMDP